MKRPSDISFVRSPGSSVSTIFHGGTTGSSTPTCSSRRPSARSTSSLPAVRSDDDNSELRVRRIEPPAVSCAGHSSRCKPGACRCGLVRVETSFDIPEPAILDETQYPRLLRRGGPDRKSLSAPASEPRRKNRSAALQWDPAEAARARVQQRIKVLGPHSIGELPPKPAAREERPEVKMRQRLYQESLAAQRDELTERISALRECLNDSHPHPRATRDRWQKLKSAMELSLQGVNCLLEDTMPSKKIIAIAQPCTPELVERGHERFPLFAQYKHSVEICAWTDKGDGTKT